MSSRLTDPPPESPSSGRAAVTPATAAPDPPDADVDDARDLALYRSSMSPTLMSALGRLAVIAGTVLGSAAK